MKLTIEPTNIVNKIDGVECRRWVGKTEGGITVHLWVRMVQPQTHDPAALEVFERELREVKVERDLVHFDYRMVI